MIEELVLRQHHVAVFVGDMERSIRFYQRCFGFRLCLTGYVEAAHERVAMLKLKDIVLELLSVDEWPTERLRTACLNTNTHFSIMVSDVAEAFEEADIRRVPNVGPMDLLVAFLRGPDGERIELLQDRNNAVL